MEKMMAVSDFFYEIKNAILSHHLDVIAIYTIIFYHKLSCFAKEISAATEKVCYS